MLFVAAIIFGFVTLTTKYWFFGALLIFGAIVLGAIDDHR